MTAHDAQFAEACLPLHFAQFGTSCTYRAAEGGAERTVTALLEREELPDQDIEIGEAEQERLWATVTRDETDGAAYPGIRYPERGDRLLVAGEDPQEAWSFQGEIRQASPAAAWWSLLFARNRPRRYGPRQ